MPKKRSTRGNSVAPTKLPQAEPNIDLIDLTPLAIAAKNLVGVLKQLEEAREWAKETDRVEKCDEVCSRLLLSLIECESVFKDLNLWTGWSTSLPQIRERSNAVADIKSAILAWSRSVISEQFESANLHSIITKSRVATVRRAAREVARNGKPCALAERGVNDEPAKLVGRPQETDPENDKRIGQEWESKNYRTFEELAKGLDDGTTTLGAKQAVDRYRKRRNKAPE